MFIYAKSSKVFSSSGIWKYFLSAFSTRKFSPVTIYLRPQQVTYIPVILSVVILREKNVWKTGGLTFPIACYREGFALRINRNACPPIRIVRPEQLFDKLVGRVCRPGRVRRETICQTVVARGGLWRLTTTRAAGILAVVLRCPFSYVVSKAFTIAFAWGKTSETKDVRFD